MYFELDEPLNESRADELWSLLNHKLKEKNLTPKDLIHKSNVKFIGTTDRITDSLTAHEQINKSDKFKFKIIPSMRLDDAVKIQKTSFLTFLKKLCQTTKRTKIVDFDTYIQALSERICYFQQKGSMLADLGLEYLFFKKGTKEEVTNIFNKCISEGQLSQDDVEILSTEIVLSLSQILYRKKWILQLHVGAIGSINDKMLKTVGRVSGFDSINDQSNIVIPLKQMLNEMNARGGIPKLIYYNIDGTKNAAIASVLAAFQENEENIEGKLQLGSAWWYQDNRQGIEKQLLDLATQGSLGSFIGMLTDSRSFLSYARHDYFRRILCNLLGEWYDRGEFPKDKLFAKHFIEKICYTNIETYLGLRLPMNPE